MLGKSRHPSSIIKLSTSDRSFLLICNFCINSHRQQHKKTSGTVDIDKMWPSNDSVIYSRMFKRCNYIEVLIPWWWCSSADRTFNAEAFKRAFNLTHMMMISYHWTNWLCLLVIIIIASPPFNDRLFFCIFLVNYKQIEFVCKLIINNGPIIKCFFQII